MAANCAINLFTRLYQRTAYPGYCSAVKINFIVSSYAKVVAGNGNYHRQGGKFRKNWRFVETFHDLKHGRARISLLSPLSRLLRLIVSYIIAKHGVFNASPFSF